MKRPLLMSRLLPRRLRQSLFYRYYHPRHAQWKGLFDKTLLEFAPALEMHGLVPGDVISDSIAFTGFYELDLSRQMKKLANTGGLLVDVGANMGYFSLLWAGANPANQVVAFEASPRNIGILRNNISKNCLSDRIAIVPKAAGMCTGTMAFDVGPPDQTGWGGGGGMCCISR